MIHHKYLFIFMMGLCTGFNALSQVDQAHFTQLTTSDGLSSNTVEAIYQDSLGFMWISNWNGLDRYDGVEFINHRTLPVGQMEVGTTIIEDSLGNLWYNQMLTKYNRADGSHYRPYFNYLDDKINLNSIRSAQMGPDHRLYLAASRNLWIADPYDPDSVVEWVMLKYGALPFENITKIEFDPEGDLWIGSNDGLYRYEEGANSLLSFEGIEYPKNKRISDFLFDKEGNLWIAFANKLVKYNFQRQSAEYFQGPNGYAGFFTLYRSSNGNILLGANSGLYYLEQGRDQIKKLLEKVWVTSICEDRAHNLWIGTYYDGVFVGNTEFNAVQNLSLNLRNQDLSTSYVSGILGDSTGLWISHTEHGLLYHDLRTGKTRVIDSASGIGKMVYLQNKNQLWYSTKDQLLCYHTDDAFIRRFNLPPSYSDNEKSNARQLPPGILAHGDYLLILSQKGRSYYFHLDSEEFTLLSYNAITKPFAVINETLYTGGDTLGILAMDETNESSDLGFLPFNKGVNRLIARSALVLHKDRYDNLWLGGWGALCMLNKQTHEFETVFDFHNTNVIVNSILEDSHGNLWIGTTNGLYRYDQKSKHFMLLGPKHGLPALRNWIDFGTQTTDGQMYFMIETRIIHFHPDKIPANSKYPPIVLTGFKVLPKFHKNNALNEQGMGEQIKVGEKVHLKYWQNSFTVKYASLNYVSPRNNQYKYRLAGMEDEWNNVGNQSRATYTSLRRGNYTFEVMGSNNEGVWNEVPCQLFIRVDSPPWWSWWSITLYVLVLLGIILAIYLYNIRSLSLQHQLELKSKESESLQEINRAKSQFFTNISHEFRTPLSLILDPAEQILSDRQTPSKQKSFAKLILNNSKRLLFLTNQILDLAKLDNNRIKLKIEETDLRELLQPTVQAFKSGAETGGLEYRIIFPEKPVMVWVDRGRIEQVVVNLLSNAFKFCAQGEIIVELSEMDDSAWIHVRDTGLGIPVDQRDHIFENYFQVDREETKNMAGAGIGLYLVKELVNLHHGIIQVQSKVNNGSTFSVGIRKGKNHFLPEQIASASSPEEGEMDYPKTIKDNEQFTGKNIPLTSKPSLLVIEDNQEMLKYLEEVLEEEYSVLKAKDGEEGYRRALEVNPDVVISDVMMPVMDGYAFCEKMKKDIRTSHIPVILLTAKTMHKDKINGLQLGADDYLQKPFHLDELKLRISYHLELRKKIQEDFLRNFKISTETELAISLNDKLLHDVFSHIDEHLHDDQFGVEKLSSLAGMSRKHLNNKIKSLTNQTTNELIRSFRLRKAAYLLSEKGISVSEACYQVGFNNLSYFSKCFAEFYGTLPSEYGS